MHGFYSVPTNRAQQQKSGGNHPDTRRRVHCPSRPVQDLPLICCHLPHLCKESVYFLISASLCYIEIQQIEKNKGEIYFSQFFLYIRLNNNGNIAQ